MIKRKVTVENMPKKKVCLPAALFNRSPLKSAENSSMISNLELNEPECENHPNKKGRYLVVSDEIEEDEETYYCEKCAILLASKGFEVKKISSDEVKITSKKANSRDVELDNFMEDIAYKSNILSEKSSKAAQQLNQLNDIYDGKSEEIVEFFNTIFTTLEKHKNKQLHELTLNKKEAEEKLSSYLGYATEKIELLENMKEDIIGARDSIVNETPENDYQLVMSHYKATLDEMKETPENHEVGNLSLPSIDSIETVLAELFQGGETGTYFSFDSSTKKPYDS